MSMMKDLEVENIPIPGTGLQNAQHKELLETISSLRTLGVDRFLNLPQLVVCGDQSAGKSSVLEAVSGLRFPAKDNTCTRFATELILQRSSKKGVKISIIPSATRIQAEKTELRLFKAPANALKDFPALIERAGKTMGIGSENDSSNFSEDVLRIELRGPGQPHLSMVDLPGIIHHSSNPADVGLVRGLVTKYLENDRTIILTVISGKSDYNTQVVAEMAREADPNRLRTLVVLTKPDLISGDESFVQGFVDLVKNSPGYGWHVLKNRDHTTRDSTTEQRDAAEYAFFQQGVWCSVPPSRLGIDQLKPKLSHILLEKVSMELPSVLMEAQNKLRECERDLARLGNSSGNMSELRGRIRKLGQRVELLIQAACEGEYDDSDFFSEETTTDEMNKRLHDVIEEILGDFACKIRSNGFAYADLHVAFSKDPAAASKTRRTLLNQLMTTPSKTTRREIDGNINPNLVAEVFYKQSSPWKQIVARLVTDIMSAVESTFKLALDHEATDQESEGLMLCIEPYLRERRRALEDVAQNALGKVQKTPATRLAQDRGFISALQKARKAHREAVLAGRLGEYIDIDPAEPAWSAAKTGVINPKNLLRVLMGKSMIGEDTPLDDKAEGDAETIACMQAYYEEALTKVIDHLNFSVVENSLLTELPAIVSLDSKLWDKMDDHTVAKIAGESEDIRKEREVAKEKEEILKAAVDKLRKLSSTTTSSQIANLKRGISQISS